MTNPSDSARELSRLVLGAFRRPNGRDGTHRDRVIAELQALWPFGRRSRRAIEALMVKTMSWGPAASATLAPSSWSAGSSAWSAQARRRGPRDSRH